MAIRGLVLGISAILVLVGTTTALGQGWKGWKDTKRIGDFDVANYGCTASASPDKDYCDEKHIGNVAVCWTDKRHDWPSLTWPGECAAKPKAWCAYKTATLATPTIDKPPPGQIYVCCATTSYIQKNCVCRSTYTDKKGNVHNNKPWARIVKSDKECDGLCANWCTKQNEPGGDYWSCNSSTYEGKRVEGISCGPDE
jgi:hypothetical protein